MNEKLRKHLEELKKKLDKIHSEEGGYDPEQEGLADEAYNEELDAKYIEGVPPMTEDEFNFGMEK